MGLLDRVGVIRCLAHRSLIVPRVFFFGGDAVMPFEIVAANASLLRALVGETLSTLRRRYRIRQSVMGPTKKYSVHIRVVDKVLVPVRSHGLASVRCWDLWVSFVMMPEVLSS